MINLVIFDLDGVLVETKDLHFKALNDAIRSVAGEEYVISWSEHLTIYDGLPTSEKLLLLKYNKGLSDDFIIPIETEKRWNTKNLLDESIKFDPEIYSIFEELSKKEIFIAVASNAIRETVIFCLEKLGIMKFVDFYVSNEDVNLRKPHPEIYWKCMSRFGVFPKDTLIVEDSAIGRAGAHASGARVWAVNSSRDVTLENMRTQMEGIIKPIKWIDKKLNVVIPMAGKGSRFQEVGYTFPKPLIEVRGKPMIQVVVDNLNMDAHFIFIVKEEHYEKYNMKSVLNLIAPGCDIIIQKGDLEGAAHTVLQAKDLIDNDNPLIIANSDQFIEWDSNATMYSLYTSKVDGGILTFESTHPKWSFAKLDSNGFVSEVAEKNPISNMATVGVYYYKHGKDFVKAADDMIIADDRFNNEFYVCPVYNYLIKNGGLVITKPVEKMWGIGTPEDLNYFLDNYEGEI